MSEEKLKNKERIQSLRVISSKLYQTIMAELEELNIHPYDMQINAIKKDNGIQVILQFGEKFTHEKEHFFTNEAIENNSPEIKEFAKETGEACQEVMIGEYFKMMRP